MKKLIGLLSLSVIFYVGLNYPISYAVWYDIDDSIHVEWISNKDYKLKNFHVPPRGTFMLAATGKPFYKSFNQLWSYSFEQADDPGTGQTSNVIAISAKAKDAFISRRTYIIKNHHSVAFDAISSATDDAVASVTYSHTTSGSNRYIATMVSYVLANPGSVSTITYAGDALTSRLTQNEPNNQRASLYWDRVAPTTGANNVVVSFSGGNGSQIVTGSISVTGADQTNPRSNTNTASGTGTAPAITITSATGEIAISNLVWRRNQTTTNTIDTNWQNGSNNWNTGDTSGNTGGSGAYIAGASSVTRTDTLTASDVWAFVGASIKAAPAVSFVSAGSIVSDLTGACAITPTPPTHVADDILLGAAWNEGGSKPSTATSGWTEIATGAGTNDATWWWKRATGAGTAGPDITAADTDCFGVVFIIRGTITSGTPYEDATTSGDGTNTDTTPDTATIDTTGINRLAMGILNHADDIAFSSGNPPSGWTADANLLSADGTDAGFAVISKSIASASTVTSVVFGTWSVGEPYWALTLAWKPPDVGGAACPQRSLLGVGC